MRIRRPTVALRMLAAALVAVIAGVHFQQYVDFMSHVPTVGVLFLLNAAGGAGLALALLTGDAPIRTLAALGGVGLAFGALVCIIIALSSSFAGFHEPTLRLPIVIAIVSEALALPACGAVAWSDRGEALSALKALRAAKTPAAPTA